ncbi:MAG: beta-N-acetylhexosaminidase [Myxococcales bacterium]|nr:beta-N-acetylhexosaminidase [Myxococcales bacterium]
MRARLLFALLVLGGCQPPEPSFLPRPVDARIEEETFTLSATTPVRAPPELADEAAWWRGQLGDFPPLEGLEGPASGAITLGLDPALGPEAYVLEVTGDGVTISGGGGAGVLYGLVTLRQALPAETFARVGSADAWDIRRMRVEDAPRFGHRGYLFDEARWFFGADMVRRVIDWMVLHRLDVLHWHLTDDQGWRIEIRAWPRLTSVGGFRAGSQLGDWFGETDEVDPTPTGGFYTQDEIRAVVDYARRRHVTVIPEIDVPGHATAALAAYPSLACTDGPFEVSPYFTTHEDILCVCEEDTFTFLESVLDEVMELFDAEAIHIGGDEVPTTRWAEDPACAALVEAEGLGSTDALHGWAMGRLARYLEARGRRAVVWYEAFGPHLPASAIVQRWRLEQDPTPPLAAGHAMIHSPYRPAYLNRDYDYASVEAAYAFDPVPDGVEAPLDAAVLGFEACMWTPWDGTVAEVEYQTFPRLAALAEGGWTPRAARDWGDFSARLPAMLERYEALGIEWGGPDRPSP